MAYVPPQCIRIAMLNADTTTPNTYAHMGTFGDILHNVLTAAASRTTPDLTLQHAVFDVVQGEYPSSPSDFDAFIITASAASALDDRPWIRQLEDYVVFLSERYPSARLFGSCFGHHIICQALLKKGGLRVEKHPRGWEIGVSDVYFTDRFRNAFDVYEQVIGRGLSKQMYGVGRLPSPEAEHEDCNDNIGCPGPKHQVPRSARLQFVHEDQVVLDADRSTKLPAPWSILGFTEHCAIQGVYRPGRVMTLQGHFEFDKFENRETMRMFGAEDELDGDGRLSGTTANGFTGQNKGRAEDDGELVAEMVLRFLIGGSAVKSRGSRQTDRMDSGMLTPRSSFDI